MDDDGQHQSQLVSGPAARLFKILPAVLNGSNALSEHSDMDLVHKDGKDFEAFETERLMMKLPQEPSRETLYLLCRAFHITLITGNSKLPDNST